MPRSRSGTRTDFSFLRGALVLGSLLALGLIVASILFGALGVVFSVAMVGLADGAILYPTSNIMYHYRTDQYVAASLCLRRRRPALLLRADDPGLPLRRRPCVRVHG